MIPDEKSPTWFLRYHNENHANEKKNVVFFSDDNLGQEAPSFRKKKAKKAKKKNKLVS